jgi:hypothetical protein
MLVVKDRERASVTSFCGRITTVPVTEFNKIMKILRMEDIKLRKAPPFPIRIVEHSMGAAATVIQM